MHPAQPDRLYQQNHCGIYRLDRPQRRWSRIGETMPRKIGDIGFPIVLDPSDPDTAWVFPMDGTTVWPRTSVGGKPAAYVTRDTGRTGAGRTRAPVAGLVQVYREAICADDERRLGLYFGTAAGDLWPARCRRVVALRRPAPAADPVGHSRQLRSRGCHDCTVRIASPILAFSPSRYGAR